MASRSKSLPLLALLVLLLLGAWGLDRLGRPPRQAELDRVSFDPVVQVANSKTPVSGDTELAPLGSGGLAGAANRGDSKVVHPLELELSLIQAGTVVVDEELALPESGANAQLKGRLSNAGRALSGRVSFLYGPNAGRVLHTDEDGQFRASDLFPGISLVGIEASGSLTSERQVALRSFATAKLNVEFASGALARLSGRVIDQAGEPLEHAQVRLDGSATTTDEEGTFRFSRVSPGKVMAVVEASGYARYMETLSIARGTVVKRDQITFRLEREAVMEVSIAENLGLSSTAELFLVPSSGGRDYPWHLVNPIRFEGGASQTVKALSPGTVTALLFKPGAEPQPKRRSIRLYSDRLNQVVLHLKPNQGLHGRVLWKGVPKSNVQVRLEAPNPANAALRLLGRHRGFGDEVILPRIPAGIQKLRTDSRGRFHFTILENTDSRYYLSATSADGRLGARSIVSALDESVELELESLPEGFGNLKVLTQARYQALPIKVTVQGVPRKVRTVLAGNSLVLGDLPIGLWRLNAIWNGRTIARSMRVEVRAEATDSVEIELPRGAIEGQTERERAKAAR